MSSAASTRHALGAPFEIWGHWWLPGRPQEMLTGQLRSFRGHLRLKLLGQFSTIDVNKRGLTVPVIHGAADAKLITLWRAVQEGFSFKAPGGVEQTFHMLRVVVGAQLGLEEDTRLTGISFDGAAIGPWADGQPVRRVQSGARFEGLRFEMNPVRRQTFGPLKDGLTYHFGAHVSTREEPFSFYGFGVIPSAHIDFATPVLCRQAIERVEMTTDLLSLLVGSDFETERIQIQVEGSSEGLDFLYEYPPPVAMDPINPREVLAPLRALEGKFADILDTWDEKHRLVGDSIKLLLDVLDRDTPQSHVRLNLLTQALEAFHRNVYGGTYLPPDSYEVIRATLVGAMPSDVPNDLRASLESRLRFGNDLSLRKRIKALLSSVSDSALAALSIDTKTFVGDVVDARNDFTHWIQEAERERPGGAHLANLISSLLALCQLVILRYLGVDENVVVSRMRETPWRYLPRYRHIGGDSE